MQGTKSQQGNFGAGNIAIAPNSFESDAAETINSGAPLKETVADKFAGAADVVHEKADAAQHVLNDKADRVNEVAHNAIEKINYFGHKAAESLERSSDYVRDFDLSETRRNLTNRVGERPEMSLAIAGIVGLALGLLIGRRR